MEMIAGRHTSSWLYWRSWTRTKYYKAVFLLFGFIRSARSRIVRRYAKKWHGPAWRRIGSSLLGTRSQLSIDKNGYLMHIRPDQINDLIAVFGRPEEHFLYDMIESLKEGDVFVDAGAYIGQYTLLAADCVGESGTVLAIEPDPQNFELLHRNVDEGHAPGNVKLVNVALGAQDGSSGRMVSVAEDSALCTLQDSLITTLYPNTRLDKRSMTVEIRTITALMEELKIDHIDLLKVDVEGAELQVLQGGVESLRAGRIRTIVCEIHGRASEVKDVLEELGYTVETRCQHVVAHYVP